jgi:predicted Zn-dependent protease with MMP-like domain
VPNALGSPPARRPDRFEQSVERALDSLPREAKRLLENVAVVIEDEPRAEQLRENRLGDQDALYGLYEGTPAVEYAADSIPFPNKISLFRLPLEADFADPSELEAEVRRTVLHELAHHAGLSDERLRALDMD